jgi:hypothetical protein
LEYVPTYNTLLSGKIATPILTAFKNDTVAWEKKVSNYDQFEAWTTSNQIGWHEKHLEDLIPYDVLTTLEYISEGIVLVQLEKVSKGNNNEGQKKLRSFLIDVETGESLKIEDMPKVMAFSNEYFISFERRENSLYSLYQY